MDRSIIEQFAKGASLVESSIQGLTPADFHAVPIPNTWSIGQIVIHLMDSDLIGCDRMKRVIAEDNPTIVGYNESLFAQRLSYHQQDPFVAADIFKKNRQLMAVILRNLPDADFARVGTHNERGKLTLEDLVQTYVRHLEHHLNFLRHKRQLLGKPL